MFRKKANLKYETVYPYRVTESCMTKSPQGLIGGGEAVTMLGGFGEASVLLDFDAEMVGGLEVVLNCSAPTKVYIGYEEEPELAKRRENVVCTWYNLVKDEFELEPGQHTLTSEGRRGFRYVYLCVTSEEDVTVKEVHAINGIWDVEEKGFFRCSDERLNRIWDISMATAKACMQDFYEDGVKRDGLLWLGDYRVGFLPAYYLTGDASLAKRSLLMIRDSQYECGAIPACAARGGGHQHKVDGGISYMGSVPNAGQNQWVILNYMTDYIVSIEEYIRFTGDTSILAEIMDSAEKAAKFLITLTDLETPGKWYMDDYKANRDEHGLNYSIHLDCTTNPNTSVESKGALLFQLLTALKSLKNLAERAENAELMAWAEETGKRLDDHIEEHYKEPRFGQYTDSKRQRFGYIMQYVAPYATLAEKEDPIGMERMMRAVTPVLGFAMAWRLEAMFKKGFVHEALRDIREFWGKMLDADSRTCWERLDIYELNRTNYYDALGSFCHSWTASPGYQLPAWVVGIRPAEDGFRSIIVEPKLDTLDFAEATVPTPHGEIFARAERDGQDCKLYLNIPEGVEKCTVKWTGDQVQTVYGGGKYCFSDKVVVEEM